MTEKQYGGATSFGFKDKNIKNSSQDNLKVSKKNEKKEIQESEMSSEEVENYLKAGKIAQEVMKFVKDFVKKDMLLIEIAEKIESKIDELGGKPAFPVNLSINEIAAHYTPSKNDLTKVHGLLKVDFGVEVEGFIADNAISFDFSDKKEFEEMVKFNREVLESTLKEISVGDKLKIIGNSISQKVSKDGRFKIIKNLSGHSLEADTIHAGLSVLNIPNESNFELMDVAIAVEPFLTTGAGEIYEGKNSEIYMLQNDEKIPRDKDSRKILEFIKENYRTKPFCKRWLESKKLEKINFCLAILVKDEILHNYPVLVEKEKKPVSQAEHTVLFSDKVYITTKD